MKDNTNQNTKKINSFLVIKEKRDSDSIGWVIDMVCLRCGEKLPTLDSIHNDYEKLYKQWHLSEFFDEEGNHLSEPPCKYAGEDKILYDEIFIVENKESIKVIK